MKKTLFREKMKDKSVEIAAVDFIYDPPQGTIPAAASIKIKDTNYKVMAICDEFTENPLVQIRQIILMKNDMHTFFFEQNLK